MLVIPFEISSTQYSIAVVLEDENIERIKQQDPAEVNPGKLPPEWQRFKLKDVIITYASTADLAEMWKLVHAGRMGDALKFLTRGFKFKPELGDHDRPYVSLKNKPQ